MNNKGQLPYELRKAQIEEVLGGNDKNIPIYKAKGEGSRGGKVIGHTKSGKPIYENFNHPSHKDFTSHDHKDANNAHAKASNKLDEQDPAVDSHYLHAMEHEKAAKKIEKKEKKD